MHVRIVTCFLVLAAISAGPFGQVIDLADTSSFTDAAVLISFRPGRRFDFEGRFDAFGLEFLGQGSSTPMGFVVPLESLDPPGFGIFTLRNVPTEGLTSADLALVIQFRRPIKRVAMELGNGSETTIAEIRALAPGGRPLGSIQRTDVDPDIGTFAGLETNDPEGILTVVVDYGDEPNAEQIHAFTFDYLEPRAFTTCIPQVADGVAGNRRLRTTLQLQALHAADNATIRLFDSAGQPLEATLNGEKASVFNVELPARVTAFIGAVKLESNGDSQPTVSGYACVETTFPVSVQAIFQTLEDGKKILSEAGIQGAPARFEQGFPVEDDPTTGLTTAIAIANPGAEENLVSLCQRTLPGSLTSCANIVLPPHGHRAFFLRQEFEDLPESRLFNGLLLRGARPFVATALRTVDGFPIASLSPASIER